MTDEPNDIDKAFNDIHDVIYAMGRAAEDIEMTQDDLTDSVRLWASQLYNIAKVLK